MKKIYNSPRMRVSSLLLVGLLAGSTQIEVTDDSASHDTEVLSKGNGLFEGFGDEE